MKNIKWILLIILIISIVITGIIFVNFIKTNNNVNKNILNSLYNKYLYFTSLTVADGDEQYFRNDSYEGKYIVITKDKIEYCDIKEVHCKVDNYTYQNNMISITTSNTLGEGNYEIELTDDELKLSRTENGKTISYYFVEAKG